MLQIALFAMIPMLGSSGKCHKFSVVSFKVSIKHKVLNRLCLSVTSFYATPFKLWGWLSWNSSRYFLSDDEIIVSIYEFRQTKQNDVSYSSATLDNCERLHGVAPSAIREIHLKTSAFYKMQTNNKIKVYVNNLLALQDLKGSDVYGNMTITNFSYVLVWYCICKSRFLRLHVAV